MSTIESVLNETRLFPPAAAFARDAAVPGMEAYRALCAEAERDYEGYWARLAREHIGWKTPFTQVLDDSNAPFFRWFGDGRLNASWNCLDRHLDTIPEKTALVFEADDGTVTRVSYRELHARVCRFANTLKARGIRAGDRVVIYLPMSVEAVVAMQACARIGATHSVVFGGFSAKSLHERILDAGAVAVLTADGQFRGGREIPLKPVVDEAFSLGGCDAVRNVIVYRRTGTTVAMQTPRDQWWHEVEAGQSDQCEPEWVDAEHPLFILYTSGSTGTPKGVQHSTGHTYVCYGPLAVGATQVIFEGVPTWPDAARFWKMIEAHKVTIFYTAPTAIRSLIKAGADLPKQHDLSTLRLLGTVGEPINPAAWQWYYDNIGGGKCPIVDTFWQTETGGHMITPLPGATPMVAGSCTLPFPGIQFSVVDETGTELDWGKGGILVCKKPWPSMIRTIWGDPDRYKKSYYPEDFNGKLYLAGDGAIRDANTGYFTITGRIDDVLNVSGHRMGTMEIESALVSNPMVAEAAVVGRPDDLTGEAICAFVVLKGARPTGDDVKRIVKELQDHVAKEIGPIAKPKDIRFGDNLPKTRSGKIMRRLLRSLAKGEEVTQDTSTLENPAILEQLKQPVV
jgi:acetyl-CoA synthetase